MVSYLCALGFSLCAQNSSFCSLDCPLSLRRTTSTTLTFYNLTWSCSSTCGNVCYADTITTMGSSLTTVHYYDVSTEPNPNCYIPTESCSSILSARPTSTFSDKSCNGEEVDTEGIFCELEPTPISHDCLISVHGQARLFYWPVPKTVSRDMCAESGPTSWRHEWTDDTSPNRSFVRT
jgi:hypothetical protein